MRRFGPLAAVAAIVAVATACSSDSGIEVGPAQASTQTIVAAPGTPPAGATTTATVIPAPTVVDDTATGAATNPAPPLGDPAVGFTEIDGFRQPVGMSWKPTDGTTYVVEQEDRKSTRLNSSHIQKSRMPSSA